MRVCSSGLCCAGQWGSVSVNQWDIVSVRTVQAPTNDVLFPSGCVHVLTNETLSSSELFWCHDFVFVSSVLASINEILFPQDCSRSNLFFSVRTIHAPTSEVLFLLLVPLGTDQWDSLSIRTVLAPTNEILFPLCLFGADQWDSLSVLFWHQTIRFSSC